MYKDILPIIDLNIIILIILSIILFMYKRKFSITEKINKLYIYMVVVTIAIIVLEILDKIISFHFFDFLVPINKIINVIRFALYPLVPYIWIRYIFEYFNIKNTSKLFIIPIIINLLLCILSYNFEYIFSVSKLNSYSRGPLFLLPLGVTLLYFFISLFLIYKNKHQYRDPEYIILLTFSMLPILSSVIQIFFNNLLLIWGSVGISLITYYVYLQERLLTYDSLTKVLNRMAFESYFNNKYINKNRDFLLIYIDINNFKIINDTYGHCEGDIALKNIAKILTLACSNKGKVGRIGGDEFLVAIDLYKNSNHMEFINKIYLELNSLNFKSDKIYNLSISIGYQKFNNNFLNISDYIDKVDTLMYIDKKKYKEYFNLNK